jgi:DNA-binding beta-propeller fold protein YncE
VEFDALSEGTHFFEVFAVDAAGNAESPAADWSWRVDLTPPQTTITAAPADPSALTSAEFTFEASEAATFECSLNGASWVACTSPKSYSGLGLGEHTFMVRANDMAGWREVSPPTYQWTVEGVPPAPTGVAASPGDGEVLVQWNAVPAATGYRVYRSTDATDYTLVADTAASQYRDSAVANSTTYYYTIGAYNAAGESQLSSIVSTTPGAFSYPPGLIEIAVAYQDDAGFVRVAWSAATAATDYQVFRSAYGQGAYVLAGTVSASAGPSNECVEDEHGAMVCYDVYYFFDLTVSTLSNWEYRIHGVNSFGAGPYSQVVTYTAPPAPPANLTATPGNGQVTLAWDAAPGATDYIVRFSALPHEYDEYYDWVTATSATSFVHTGLANGYAHFYSVIARRGGDEGPPAYAYATPFDPGGAPPGAVTGLSVLAEGYRHITLAWDAIAGATQYHVFVSDTSGAPYELAGVTDLPSYTHVGMNIGDTEYFVVSAATVHGVGPTSAEVAAAASYSETSFCQVDPFPRTVERRTIDNELQAMLGVPEKMNTPVGIAHHPGRDELFVTNPWTGSILVYSGNASGEAAPLRVIHDPDSFIPVMPAGIAIDTVNDEIYVASRLGRVAVYPVEASGTLSPVRTISTGSFPGDVAVDPIAGELYVTELLQKRVYVYSIGSTTPTSSIRQISLAFMPLGIAAAPGGNVLVVTGMDGGETFIAVYSRTAVGTEPPLWVREVDEGVIWSGVVHRPAENAIYVSEFDGFVEAPTSRVAVYSLAATGGAPPIRTILNPTPGFPLYSSVAYDSLRDELIVGNGVGAAIHRYPALGNGAVAITRSLYWRASGMQRPISLAYEEAANRYWVLDLGRNAVLAYDAAATGQTSPVAVIEGPNTGLSLSSKDNSAAAQGIGVELISATEVAVFSTDQSIRVYQTSANGDAAPSRHIAGPATEIEGPGSTDEGERMTVNRNTGEVFVNNSDTGRVVVFSAGANGNVAPARTIALYRDIAGSEVFHASAIGFDHDANRLVVAGDGFVAFFDPASAGPTEPLRDFRTDEWSPLSIVIEPENQLVLLGLQAGVVAYPRYAIGRSPAIEHYRTSSGGSGLIDAAFIGYRPTPCP